MNSYHDCAMSVVCWQVVMFCRHSMYENRLPRILIAGSLMVTGQRKTQLLPARMKLPPLAALDRVFRSVARSPIRACTCLTPTVIQCRLGFQGNCISVVTV